MFKSMTIYQCTQATADVLRLLDQGLSESSFEPCKPSDKQSWGFVPPLGDDTTEMTYETNGAVLFRLRIDHKSIPSARVNELVAVKAAKQMEAENKPKLTAGEKSKLKEAAIEELTSKHLPETTYFNAYIDKQLHMMVVEKAEEDADTFIEYFRKAMGGAPFEALGIEKEDPSDIFTEWLQEPGLLGDHFEIGHSASLKHAKEGGVANITIKNDELEEHCYQEMLKKGKKCCRLDLVHQDAEFAIKANLGLSSMVLGKDAKAQIGNHDEKKDELAAEFAVRAPIVRDIITNVEPLLGGFPKQELLDLHDEQPPEDKESEAKRKQRPFSKADEKLYGAAVKHVIEGGIASTDNLKSAFKIDQKKADRVMARMEAEGVVSEKGEDGERQIIEQKESA